MATSADVAVETIKQETIPVPETDLDNSHTNGDSGFFTDKKENSLTNKIFRESDKISASWNHVDAELPASGEAVPNDISPEKNCSDGVEPADTDYKQNILDQSVLFHPDNWTVDGDSQIWVDSSWYNNNNFQSYGRKFGGYKANSGKNNYHQHIHGHNPQFNQGTCNHLPRNNNLNTMSYPVNGQHVVHLHVNPGETISFNMGDHMQLIQGPATVRMVSNNSNPPVPMPVQVPPGHMVQQIVDEQGTLRHIILSPQPPVAVSVGNPYNAGTSSGNVTSPVSGSVPFYLYPHQSYSFPSQFHLHMQAGLQNQGLHSPNEHLHSQPNDARSPNPGLLDQSSPHAPFKDERTQRQFFKLKKRLEARQKDASPLSDTTDSDGQVRTDHKSQSHMDVEQPNEDAKVDSRLVELLSTIKAPSVSSITDKSALIKWTPLDLNAQGDAEKPAEFKESDLLYAVVLCEKHKATKQKVFQGAVFSHELVGLKPATCYYVRIQVTHGEVSGNCSEAVIFNTCGREPDAPQPPKLQSRTKTSISLKWNAAVDNGSKITFYTLEYAEGTDTDKFVDLFQGLQKQYKAVKLKASTCYRFRLAATNEYGESLYSDISCFSTSGSPPSQPLPPTLNQAGVNKLVLSWELRPNDDSYTLQMEDETTLHGFLPVYNGKETSYTCVGLKRNSSYKFRLCAINEEGSGPWSQAVDYSTLPDKPDSPGKPGIKGRSHSSFFKLAWDPPKDDGGAPIASYHLELEKENGFEPIYSGTESEYLCENLQPGKSYSFRVQCKSPGGSSAFSDVGIATTNPVVPGKCSIPRLLGKPKAASLHLKWVHPECDGGSEISGFEIEITSPSDSIRTAYKGPSTDCLVAGLLPGRLYSFHVRAFNKVGNGPWSDIFETMSGAGAPDVPKDVQVIPRSPHCMFVSWSEPASNGAIITEYRLESKHGENNFELVYSGALCSTEVKTLIPATTYVYQVQAVNSAGAGSFSDGVSGQTLPSSPGSVSTANIKDIVGATTIALSWKEPSNHGSEITCYNIEVGDHLYTTSSDNPEICIEGLAPETTYKVRIQAINSVGPGPFSSSMKILTRGLPPLPPILECTGSSHNSLRLKWGDGKNPDFKTYTLEMENLQTKKFIIVYQGTSQTFKVSKLQEMTSYSFRIYASNEEGDGPCSEISTFKTQRTLPASLKAPKIVSVGEMSGVVEWTPAKPIGDDVLTYRLYLSSKESDFHVIYTGTNTSFTINDLRPGMEYSLRVNAVRHCSNGAEFPGPFSPCSSLCTNHPESSKSSPPKMMSVVSSLTDRQPLSDQQWAIIILFGFTFFAICVAIIIERILSYTTS